MSVRPCPSPSLSKPHPLLGEAEPLAMPQLSPVLWGHRESPRPQASTSSEGSLGSPLGRRLEFILSALPGGLERVPGFPNPVLATPFQRSLPHLE